MSANLKEYATPNSFRRLVAGVNVCKPTDYGVDCIVDGRIGEIVFANGETVNLSDISLSEGWSLFINIESIEVLSGEFIIYQN